MYYIYMLRCVDNSIYTGMTTDIERRMEEHFSQDNKCAKYTLRHKPEKLENAWETDNRRLAAKLEYHIKELKKVQKEELIKNHRLEQFLSDIIDVNRYRLIGENNYGNRKTKK